MKCKVKVKIFFFCLNLLTFCCVAQQVGDPGFYQKRFDNYLNFKGSLSPYVKIDADGVKLYKDAASKKSNTAELIIFWDEVSAFNSLMKNQATDTVEAILKRKENKKWKDKNMYVLPVSPKEKIVYDPLATSPLKGLKVAIDPGHIAGNMEMARIEQKYLHFSKDTFPSLLQDSVDIAEGILTFQTVSLLKKMLEEKGATVMLTRSENSTAFGLGYDEWLKKRKKIILDSLKITGDLTATRYKQLMNYDEKKFFWEFFRDQELAQRIKKINAFQPDITVIIHYNVDEKNKDWVRPSQANYTMAFIGGGMTADSFKKMKGKMHFLRLLLSDDLLLSEKLAAHTVQQFNSQLGVTIAKQYDADYLKDNCLASGSDGVFCRNLALCRMINSPLVYGECLYQDNINELYLLSKQDKTYYGIPTNERVYKVATAYFEAIKLYYKK